MLGEVCIAFLGTSAGEGPTASRGAPCILVHLGKEMWMVDCGDGSYRQLQQLRALHSPRAALPGAQVDFSPRVPITRIFVTHLHPGHVAGLALMLIRLLDEAVTAEVAEQLDRDRERDAPNATRAPHVTLVGPAGLRRFLRTGLGALRCGQAVPRGRYAVHELLLDDDARTSCAPSQLLQPCEMPGRDIACDRSGLWREFEFALGGEVKLSAGPVLHTVPSIGYIFAERAHGVSRRSSVFDPDSPPSSLELSRSQMGSSSGESDDEDGASSAGGRSRRSSVTHTSVISPAVARDREREPVFRGRKVVILGDTCDASSLARLAFDASLVVHEATDTHLPHESSGAVRERVVARGHSTAQMAGAFAKSVRAKQLVLYHFCARFPAPIAPNDAQAQGMAALATQASKQWGARDPKALVIAAKDFDVIAIPPETSTYSPPLEELRPTHRRSHSSSQQQPYATAPHGPPYPQPMYPAPQPPPPAPSQRGPSPNQAAYPEHARARPPSFVGHGAGVQVPVAPVPYTFPPAPPRPVQRGPSPPTAVFMDPGHRASFAGQPQPPPNRRLRSF